MSVSIAHEVNQPLAAVVNNANACLNLLRRATPDPDEVRNALAEIVEVPCSGRIRQLAQRTPCERSLLDLRTVIADVLLLARGESSARQVTIRTEQSEELLPVFGGRVQLQQVLLNLVVNGMEAMDTVEVSKRTVTAR
jgi:two-component system, LuxR family, sensor kinase FixL